MSFSFFLNSALLGVGLAMDAFSVSLANGLNEPRMSARRMNLIAGTFGAFQALMPLLGWACVHTAARYFSAFQRAIPWAAMGLLGFIGGKMLIEGLGRKGGGEKPAVGFGALMAQGVATSIDALSVGFAISDYNAPSALAAAAIIAAVTFVICLLGLVIGKRFGTKLSNSASVLGGAILIGIGLKILLEGVL